MIGADEFKEWSMFRRLFAEFLGTFLLVTILMSGIHEMKSVVEFALANGLLLASIIAYTGHVSGGHINPAVTLGVFTCGFIKLLPGLFYIIAQILGALLGQLVAKAIVYKEMKNDTKIDALPAFGFEVLETFLLVSVVISVSDVGRYSRGIGSASLAIGLCVAASLCAVADYKAVMNPAVGLGASVFKNSFENHWVCWAGPLVGGLLAGLIYRCIMSYNPPRNN